MPGLQPVWTRDRKANPGAKYLARELLCLTEVPPLTRGACTGRSDLLSRHAFPHIGLGFPVSYPALLGPQMFRSPWPISATFGTVDDIALAPFPLCKPSTTRETLERHVSLYIFCLISHSRFVFQDQSLHFTLFLFLKF